MTRSQILDVVLGRCGRQAANTYLRDQAELELGLIQERYEFGAWMPWFLLSDETSLTFTADERSVTLSTDFLREYEDFPVYVYDSTADDPYRRLNKDEFDVLEELYGEDAAGTPLAYSLQGEQYQLFPTPDADGTLRYKYFKKGAVLSDSTEENVWTEHASGLLLAELGIVMAGMYIKNSQLEQRFMRDREIAYRELFAFDEARKQALRDAQRGDRS